MKKIQKILATIIFMCIIANLTNFSSYNTEESISIYSDDDYILSIRK